jgi:hypothetical protein
VTTVGGDLDKLSNNNILIAVRYLKLIEILKINLYSYFKICNFIFSFGEVSHRMKRVGI